MFKDLPSRIRTIYHKAKLSYSLVNQIATDSPKVSAYLPPAVYDVPPTVYDELEAFKEKRGLQSVEIAVTTILAEYFGQLQPSLNPATDTTESRLKSLEAKCTSLLEAVAELQMAIATLQSSGHLSNQNVSADRSAASSPQQIVEPTIEFSHVDDSEPIDLTDHHGVEASTSEPPAPATFSDSLLIQPPSELLNSSQDTLPSTPNDLETEVQSEVETVSEPLSPQSFSAPMTQAALARRLKVSTSSISRMQSKPSFPQWSQQKDPEGIAWVRSAKTKEFYPQNNK